MNSLQSIAHWMSQYHLNQYGVTGQDLALKFAQISDHEFYIQSDLPCAFLEQSISADLKQAFPHDSFQWQKHILPHLTQMPGMGLKNIANTIAIVSGKGGVGKSTIASNLACAAQILGADTALLDADIYGPSLCMMMGITEKMKLNEDDQYIPSKRYGVECMSMGMLQNDAPFIWRGPMLAKALLELINRSQFSKSDYLFIDMPPGTGDIPLSLVQKVPLAGAIIVTTPQNIATLDAEKALQMFLKMQIPVLGLISNMAYYECRHCEDKSYIFGQTAAQELADRYHIPLLGELPLNIETRAQADLGQPIVLCDQPISNLWLRICLAALIQLSKRPLNHAAKIPPIRKA